MTLSSHKANNLNVFFTQIYINPVRVPGTSGLFLLRTNDVRGISGSLHRLGKGISKFHGNERNGSKTLAEHSSLVRHNLHRIDNRNGINLHHSATRKNSSSIGSSPSFDLAT